MSNPLGGQRLVAIVTAKADRGREGSEERVVLWGAATGKILQTTQHRTAMDVLAVAPDGRRFAEAGASRMVRIRHGETLAVEHEFRVHDERITALAWHPSKPILATASADLSIRLWNLDTGKRLEELRGSLSASHALAFSPSGQRLASASGDFVTRVWEPKSLSDQPDPDKAEGWEDLLASFTPAAVAQTGHGWRMDNGVLSSPPKPYATLPLPGDFANTSYRVKIKARQLNPQDSLDLNLPIGGRQITAILDGAPKEGWFSGLSRVAGGNAKGRFGVEGKKLQDAEQHEWEISVHLEGANARIESLLDGEPLFKWSGPVTELSLSEQWQQGMPGPVIALGSQKADWVVYEVKAKRL